MAQPALLCDPKPYFGRSEADQICAFLWGGGGAKKPRIEKKRIEKGMGTSLWPDIRQKSHRFTRDRQKFFCCNLRNDSKIGATKDFRIFITFCRLEEEHDCRKC